MAVSNGDLVLCVEDELYRTYLEQAFAGAGTPCTSVAVEDLAQTIAESPSGILLLQSDTAEQNLIELSSRLKLRAGVNRVWSRWATFAWRNPAACCSPRIASACSASVPITET